MHVKRSPAQAPCSRPTFDCNEETLNRQGCLRRPLMLAVPDGPGKGTWCRKQRATKIIPYTTRDTSTAGLRTTAPSPHCPQRPLQTSTRHTMPRTALRTNMTRRHRRSSLPVSAMAKLYLIQYSLSQPCHAWSVLGSQVSMVSAEGAMSRQQS